ncbi:MAG: hypothetical protein IJV67_03885, partial [Clostridia bacterium]|nr:hypothetical protein [Clostridia bacterium]
FIKMMHQSDYPSFGYWIEKGATTLWEDFEGTNSRNHHMFADIVSVMQNYLLGVRQSEDKLIIKPCFKFLNVLKGTVITANGIVKVDLSYNNGKVNGEVSIPFGLNATLYLPDKTIQLTAGTNAI